MSIVERKNTLSKSKARMTSGSIRQTNDRFKERKLCWDTRFSNALQVTPVCIGVSDQAHPGQTELTDNSSMVSIDISPTRLRLMFVPGPSAPWLVTDSPPVIENMM